MKDYEMSTDGATKSDLSALPIELKLQNLEDGCAIRAI